MPFAWAQSLWKARILLDGKWSSYMGFHPQNSINSLFYRTQWINFDRYGRRGESPNLGLGNYPLRNWFHLSLPASYIYSNAGAVTTLSCTLVWVLSNFIWLFKVNLLWVFAVTSVLFLSTTAYAMAFARQNYQILGWMWIPSALYLTNNGDLVLANIAWIGAGLFGGITPILCAIPIITVLALLNKDISLLFVLLPAFALVSLRFSPFISTGDVVQALSKIAKMIGLSRRKVRYEYETKCFGISNLYFFSLYTIVATLMSWSQGEIVVLPFLGSLLFLVNQCFLRVADEQSIIVVAASLFAFTAMHHTPNLLMLLFFFLAVNPLPIFLSIHNPEISYEPVRVLVNPPFDHTKLEAGFEMFIKDVAAGERILFAFNDPMRKWDNIFDGYRVVHELHLYVAAKKGIHLFPDWWAVGETNYDGAPQCWGRSLNEVVDNCTRWHANYAIVYQDSLSSIECQWLSYFNVINELDWCDSFSLPKGTKLWPASKPAPKLFLLRRIFNSTI